MKINKPSLPFFLFVFSFLFFGNACLAEEQKSAVGFSIVPFYQEINIEKDQAKAPFVLEVKNNTKQSAVFRVSVLDFGTLDETGGVAFLGSGDNLKYSLASWVSLQNDTLLIEAGGTARVNGYVENRDSLSPGGHYGAIYLKNEDKDGLLSQKQSVALDPSVASLLFVRKRGGEITELKLDSKNFKQNVFFLIDSVKLRFQNTGNVHIFPRGTIKITDPFDAVVKSGVINEQSAIILPETFRVFPTKLMELKKAIWPGVYKISISYRFDGKDDFVQDSTNFLFVPLFFVVFFLAFIGGIVGFLIFRNKKRQNNVKTGKKSSVSKN